MKINDMVIDSKDFGKVRLEDLFKKMLLKLWTEGEGFDVVDGGWQFDVYKALIENGCINGTIDEDGFVEDVDEKAADFAIGLLIGSLR